MILSPRARARINIPILLVSAIAWMMLLVNPGNLITLAHCPVTDSGASVASFRMLMAINAKLDRLLGEEENDVASEDES